MTRAPLKSRILRAGGITVAGSGILIVLGTVVRMVIARVYGPEGMGEYAGFTMFIKFFGIIAVFSLPRAVLKFAAEYEEKNEFRRIRELFSSIFILLTASCLLVAVASQLFIPALMKFVNLPVDRTLSLFLGLTLVMATHSVLTSTLFLGLMQNIRAFVISISSMLVMIGLAGAAYFILPFPVYFLLVAGYLASSVIGIILARRQGFLGLTFSGGEVKKAFRFALPIVLMSYFGFAAEWFDRFALGMYFGAREMGLFSAGLVVFTATRKIPLSLSEVLVPSYSKISLHGKEVLARAYGKNLYYYALLFFFVAAGLVLYRRELIVLLFTPEFLPAADILLILSGSFVLSVITNPGSSLLVGCGYTKLNTVNYIVGVAVLIPALVIFTRLWGIRGAAAAKMLAHFATTAGMLFILVRVVKLRIAFGAVLKLLLFTLAVGAIAGLIKHHLAFIGWSLLFLAAAYFGGLWFFLLSPEDKRYLKDIRQKSRRSSQFFREPGVKWPDRQEGAEGPGRDSEREEER